MLEPRVEDFFDTAQLGRPGAPHLVETGIDVGTQVVDVGIYVGAQIVYTGIYIANAGIYVPQSRVIDQDADHTVSMVGSEASAIDNIWLGLISMLPLQR